uniref:Uncharacterized protein n=1 Tax=Anguilla anguilla TaxID=7936 RepID=A0A0E9R7D9_ANGAN
MALPQRPWKLDKPVDTEVILDVISGQKSQALNGILPVTQVGESGLCTTGTETGDPETTNELGDQIIVLTHVEAEPGDSLVSDVQQQESPHSSVV